MMKNKRLIMRRVLVIRMKIAGLTVDEFVALLRA